MHVQHSMQDNAVALGDILKDLASPDEKCGSRAHLRSEGHSKDKLVSNTADDGATMEEAVTWGLV
jgi:hypothetical protein